ncbi:hypothetical protein Tco_1128650 [Tanacetum coccineum]
MILKGAVVNVDGITRRQEDAAGTYVSACIQREGKAAPSNCLVSDLEENGNQRKAVRCVQFDTPNDGNDGPDSEMVHGEKRVTDRVDDAETCIGYAAAVTKSDIAAGFTADAADEADGECINSTQNDEGVQVLSHAKLVYSNNDGKLNSFVGLPGSFAGLLKGTINQNVNNKLAQKMVKISELHNSEFVEGVALVIPLEAVEKVGTNFANTLYGYFIGKRLAYHLVENYVKNTWSKFGLKRVKLQNRFFFFQFSSREGDNDRLVEKWKHLFGKWTSSHLMLTEEKQATI